MKKKISKILKISSITLGIGLLTAPAFAVTDYSQMDTATMNEMRGTMRDASQEERDAFRNEWRSRLNNMEQAERQNYSGRPANAAGDGSGNRYGGGGSMGSGGGMGGGGGMGRGRR